MPRFVVNDMTCGHCVATVTRALQQADPAARVEIDLARHLVQVEGGTLDAPRVAALITEAGYTPEPLPA
ncbi:MAG: heavy-metal-associated domain-containing protein [Rubrivivax sp.]